MEYAVVEIAGKQYSVTPGQTILVNKLKNSIGDMVDFATVLAHATDAGTIIGTPYVDGVTISGEVVEHKKGKKIHVLRFRAKSHYHKATGHRQEYSAVAITGIGVKKKAAKA